MRSKRNIIEKVKIETIQAKVTLKLAPCPECGGMLSFYLDCPFGDGNIINPEICTEQCNVKCEALVYCESCDYEDFIELFPKTGLPLKKGLKERDVV
ncbi:MAG: hypothetical protein FK730_02545 [Asgard group archaeon]|nr:hypothetical protein [Asgard group archaeon]